MYCYSLNSDVGIDGHYNVRKGMEFGTSENYSRPFRENFCVGLFYMHGLKWGSSVLLEIKHLNLRKNFPHAVLDTLRNKWSGLVFHSSWTLYFRFHAWLTQQITSRKRDWLWANRTQNMNTCFPAGINHLTKHENTFNCQVHQFS